MYSQHFLLFPQYFQTPTCISLRSIKVQVVWLPLCHTIPTFNDPEKESFWNIMRKGENAGNQLLKSVWEREKMLGNQLFLLQNVSYPSQTYFTFYFTFILLFANAFSLDYSTK